MNKSIRVTNAVLIFNGEEISYKVPLGVLKEPFSRFRNVSKSEIEKDYKSFYRIEFDFEYNSETTIRDLCNEVLKRINFSNKSKRHSKDLFEECIQGYGDFGFVEEGILCYFNDELSLDYFIEKYNVDRLYTCIVYSNQSGEILREGNLRFFIHSKEKGHNTSHVHVDYKHEKSASISILTGEVIAGSLPSREMKEAQKIILDNRLFLLEYWNKQTDGIKVDLNQKLGIYGLSYPSSEISSKKQS